MASLRQLISANGTFDLAAHEQFINTSKFDQCGLSYRVVSIIGPQSSGKSTLLNQLFGTNFMEMDARKGRSQTTEGVWMANGLWMEPFTIVMDLEGSDSGEREDDKTFERQSALFALAVSDVVLINMWCHEIGREGAANKPLLRTILQVYVTKLVRPGKTTLMFVIRDKTETPLGKLINMLHKDIQEIWDKDVSKPQEHLRTPLRELFDVQVQALSNRRLEKEQFNREVECLKQRLSDIASQDWRSGVRVPASGFPFSCQDIWETIRANKDLNIPAHKILVAIIRCGDIANDTYSSFEASKEWRQMNELVESGSNYSGFRKKLSTIVLSSLDRYDKSEAMHFDECVRLKKRQQLLEQLLRLVAPIFGKAMRSIQRRAFEEFREALRKAVNGGTDIDSAARSCINSFMTQFNAKLADAGFEHHYLENATREELESDIDAHIDAFRHGLPSPEDDAYELRDVETSPVEEIQRARDPPPHRFVARRPKKLKYWVMLRFAWKAFCKGLMPLTGIDFSSFF